MKVLGECLFENSDLDRMYDSLKGRKPKEEFLKIIKDKKLKRLTVKELQSIVEFINREKNLRFKLSKEGKKARLVSRVENYLFQRGDISPRPIRSASSPSSLLDSISIVMIAGSSRRSSDETILSDRIVFDEKFDHHHFIFHPLYFMKDVVILKNGCENSINVTVNLSLHEIKQIKTDELQFHIYSLKCPMNESFSSTTLHPVEFSSENIKISVNGHENPTSYTSQKRCQFNLRHKPFIINPQLLKSKNDLSVKVTRSINQHHTIIYFSVVRRSSKFPDEVMNLMQAQTNQLSELQNFNFLNDPKEDGDCFVNDVIVSLEDPISQEVVKIPAKGSKCQHPGAFDFETFLHFCSMSWKFECPFCNRYIPVHELMIDRKTMDILSKITEEDDISKVRIGVNSHGFYPISSRGKRMGKISLSVDVIEKEKMMINLDDDEEEEEENGEEEENNSGRDGRVVYVMNDNDDEFVLMN